MWPSVTVDLSLFHLLHCLDVKTLRGVIEYIHALTYGAKDANYTPPLKVARLAPFINGRVWTCDRACVVECETVRPRVDVAYIPAGEVCSFIVVDLNLFHFLLCLDSNALRDVVEYMHVRTYNTKDKNYTPSLQVARLASFIDWRIWSCCRSSGCGAARPRFEAEYRPGGEKIER